MFDGSRRFRWKCTSSVKLWYFSFAPSSHLVRVRINSRSAPRDTRIRISRAIKRKLRQTSDCKVRALASFYLSSALLSMSFGARAESPRFRAKFRRASPIAERDTLKDFISFIQISTCEVMTGASACTSDMQSNPPPSFFRLFRPEPTSRSLRT